MCNPARFGQDLSPNPTLTLPKEFRRFYPPDNIGDSSFYNTLGSNSNACNFPISDPPYLTQRLINGHLMIQ